MRKCDIVNEEINEKYMKELKEIKSQLKQGDDYSPASRDSLTVSNQPLIVGILGHARAGKDTIANYLMANYGFHKESFAWKVKQIGEELFDTFYYRKTEIVYSTNLTKRQILQKIGTALREIDQGVWWKYLMREIYNKYTEPDSKVVIPDVRYMNECMAVKFNYGKLIKIIRTDGETDLTEEEKNHPSETEMDTVEDRWFDLIIKAKSGELNKIYREVDKFMEGLENEKIT